MNGLVTLVLLAVGFFLLGWGIIRVLDPPAEYTTNAAGVRFQLPKKGQIGHAGEHCENYDLKGSGYVQIRHRCLDRDHDSPGPASYCEHPATKGWDLDGE